MALPKLIFIEGLPNSGKTTLLNYVCDFLSENKIPSIALYETDNSNPIEYYCNAFYLRNELQESLQRYGLSHLDIEEYAVELCGGYLVRKEKPLRAISHDFYEEAHKHNFFNLPLALGFHVMDKIIENFVNSIKNDKFTYIIECAILQNPMRAIILGKNQESIFQNRVVSICKSFSRHEFITFMNYHEDPAAMVYNHARRGQGWTSSCIHEFTENDYGRERSYVGIEGAAYAYRELQDIQIKALGNSKSHYYLIDNTDYEQSNREKQVANILSKLMI